MLVGNLVALFSPVFLIPLFTFIKPDAISYDFDSIRAIVYLKNQSRYICFLAIIITLCLTVICPWPIYASSYIFSRSTFTNWIVIGIIWTSISFLIVENFEIIKSVLRLTYFDIQTFRERD